MNKKKIIFAILCISLLFLIYVKNNYQSDKISFIKKLIPENVKILLKKSIFLSNELEKELELANNQIEGLRKEYNKRQKTFDHLKHNLIAIQQQKNLVNEEIFPNTQFLKLNFKEVNLNLKSKNPQDPLSTKRHGKKVSPFYIENSEKYLFIIFKNGDLYKIELESLFGNTKNHQFKYIKNNLPEFINVKDILIDNNIIYVSLADSTSNCQSMRVLEANLLNDTLNFTEFFSLKNFQHCEDKKNENVKFKKGFYNGGRIEIFFFDDKKKMILAAEFADDDLLPELFLKRNKKSFVDDTVKHLMIDFETKKIDIYASGHRNPQGLVVTKNEKILTTDHGVRGGDEINKVEYKQHYGWPIASYGETYIENYNNSDSYIFKKNHYLDGFKEPMFAFVPSIGISEIIELPNSFHPRWQNNFLISSLIKGSLYRINFNESLDSVVFFEEIRLNKRIRDLHFVEKYNSILIALENSNGSIGIIKPD